MATHQVHIDARSAVLNTNNSSFTVQLNENLHLGPDTTYRIDAFRMVNSMPNITPQNQNMYVFINGATYVVPLPPGYCSANGLTQIMPPQLNTYAAGSSGWGVTWDSSSNFFKIMNNSAFHLVNDAELAAGTYAPSSWPSGASATNPLVQRHPGKLRE